MMEVIDTIASLVILSALIPLAIFIVRYLSRSPWSSTKEGKNLLYQKAILLFLILLSTATFFLGDYPGREIIRLAGFLSIVYLFWVDVYQLLKVQKKHPYRRKPRK